MFYVVKLQREKKKEKDVRYSILQVQLTAGIAKGTRKPLKLLTILFAFSSEVMKRAHVPISPFTKKNMRDM